MLHIYKKENVEIQIRNTICIYIYTYISKRIILIWIEGH